MRASSKPQLRNSSRPPFGSTAASKAVHNNNNLRTRSVAATPPRTIPYNVTLPQTVHVDPHNIPLLFTAPHGLELFRFRNEGKTKIVHKREQFTTELVLLLSVRVPEILHSMWIAGTQQPQEKQKMEPSTQGGIDTCTKTASFCVWNCVTSKPFDVNNTDPNYTFKSQFPTSPWNAALRAFKEATTSTTSIIPLHIDLHGKYDRDDNFALDVGLESFYAFRAKSQPRLSSALRNNCEAEFSIAVASCPIRMKGFQKPVGDLKDENGATKPKQACSFSASVDMDPCLHGLWGTDVDHPHMPVTMTTQAVLLDIPSFQLELPLTMRKAMMSWYETRENTAAFINNSKSSSSSSIGVANPMSQKSRNFFEAFALAIAKIFLGIQNAPANVVLDIIFGQSNTSNNMSVNGKYLAEYMLNDCSTRLRCEKAQI